MSPKRSASPGKPPNHRGRYKATLGLIMASAAVLTVAVPASAQATTSGFRQIANIPVGVSPRAVGVDPGRNLFYVAGAHQVAVVSGRTQALVTTIPIGINLSDLAVDPATHKIYVTDFADPDVFVINGRTNTVTAKIAIPAGARGITVDPVTDMVYASAADTVLAISGQSNKVVATLPVGAGSLACDPATGTIYAASAGIAVISEQTNTVTATIPIPSGVNRMAVDPTRDIVYASIGTTAARRPKGVDVINGQTNQVTTTINQPGVTVGVAVNPVTNDFYFVNRRVADIWRFSGATDTVLKRLPLAAVSDAVAVDPVNNTIAAAPDAHLIHDLTIFKG